MPQICTIVPGSSSTIVHHCSQGLRYVARMKRRPHTADTIVINLRHLMRETGLKPAALATKSGVSKRMIDYILTKERTPTIEVAEALAGAFGLTGWQLLLPDLPVHLAKKGKLDNLLSNYASSSETGREYIDRVAEQEAKYGSK